MKVTLFHNPRCSKSRQTLKIVTSHGHTPEVIEYLKTPPDAAALDDLLSKLDMLPMDIMRTGEEPFKAARSDLETMERDAQIKWLADNPRALQRPILVVGQQARVGRPPESILEILP